MMAVIETYQGRTHIIFEVSRCASRWHHDETYFYLPERASSRGEKPQLRLGVHVHLEIVMTPDHVRRPHELPIPKRR